MILTDGKERYLVTSLKRRSTAEILSFYKRRFRIENAFRDMLVLLLRTCSRDERVRPLYFPPFSPLPPPSSPLLLLPPYAFLLFAP